MYQAIIVGAGPAGAYLAYLLSREGIQVLLLEKERLPRNKICAGGLTAKSLKLLSDFNLQPLIEDTIHKAIFSCKRARPLELNFDRPLVQTVNRLKFDSFLVEKAKEAGAKVLDGVNITKVQSDQDHVTVYSSGSEWQGKLLAGADGALSTVARSSGGFTDNRQIMVSLLEQQIYLPKEQMEQNHGLIKMDYGMLPTGYTWLFPKSDHISVGIGSIGLKAKTLREFLGKAIQSKGYTSSTGSTPVRGWFIPVMVKPPVLHHQRIVLLGDAAGLVDALTGEGIFSALFSARLAAEVIIDQINKPQPNLESYTVLVRENLWTELRSSYNIARWFYRFPGVVHRIFQHIPDFSNIFGLLFAGELTYAEFLRSGGKRLLPMW